MLHRLALILLALLSFACTGPQVRDVRVQGFSAHDTEQVAYALQAWADTGAVVWRQSNEVGERVLLEQGPAWTHAAALGQARNATQARVDANAISATSDAMGRDRDELFRATVMHELGHVLGLPDSSVGLMAAPFDYSAERLDVIDQATLDAL